MLKFTGGAVLDLHEDTGCVKQWKEIEEDEVDKGDKGDEDDENLPLCLITPIYEN